jgi:hypothetical protein
MPSFAAPSPVPTAGELLAKITRSFNLYQLLVRQLVDQ